MSVWNQYGTASVAYTLTGVNSACTPKFYNSPCGAQFDGEQIDSMAIEIAAIASLDGNEYSCPETHNVEAATGHRQHYADPSPGAQRRWGRGISV